MGTVVTCPLTISSLTLGTAPFRERIRAAAAAGFQSVGLSVEAYGEARRSGLDDDAMRALLDEHGLTLGEVEFLSDWAPRADGRAGDGEGDGDGDGDGAIPSAKELTAFHIARTFGADHINVGLFDATPLDVMADRFTALCERAGELRIALEYMPFGAVPDLPTAWELVRRTGRPNAGLVLDVWHWVRGATAPEDLSPVPAARIFTVQLCDVGPDPLPDMRQESLHLRLVPGSRTDAARRLLGLLEAHGVRTRVSAEVMSDALLAQGAEATAQAVYAATRAVLAGHPAVCAD
ncbi:sugar phosphate isomerase/epimerase [Streptomyces sp. ISL-43]|uniref:sugar phosphate isomerase/epimerase family protein n=1 Tax=Streptomyces sp. ISL-43 TaxID=2819183 RepID=UPI001BE60E7E|nr:sugar phosphate isomerase/epimerase [Streptomyces sp. ISL-43]MBT2446522.1 sugar phosphate isomerase/epimerase [Streptomyces sp. ISL-43]